MAVCGSCDARDGDTQQGTLSDRAGASLRGSSRWVGWSAVRPGVDSRAKARLNFSAQGQRSRCRVNRRAERVSRPAREKNRRRRVLVVAIRSPRQIRAFQQGRACGPSSGWPLAAKRPEGRLPDAVGRVWHSRSRGGVVPPASNSPSRSVMKHSCIWLGTGRRLHPPDDEPYRRGVRLGLEGGAGGLVGGTVQ